MTHSKPFFFKIPSDWDKLTDEQQLAVAEAIAAEVLKAAAEPAGADPEPKPES